jgi:alkylation response protein AidB-like acyl-CoA dehydrogenase
MGPLGLLGLLIPEEYGGAGVDAVSAALAIEELGWGCGSTGLAIAAHNGLGCAPLTLFGSPELKQRFLLPAATGQGRLAALALTEPGAGSDLRRVRSAPARAEWVIGNKMGAPTPAGRFIVTWPHRPRGGFQLAGIVHRAHHGPRPAHRPGRKENGLERVAYPRGHL